MSFFVLKKIVVLSLAYYLVYRIAPFLIAALYIYSIANISPRQ